MKTPIQIICQKINQMEYELNKLKGMVSKYMVPTGYLIHKRRKELGLSLMALAKQVGCSHTAIANIENGARNGSNHLLTKIMGHLNLSLENILKEQNNENKNN